MSDPEGRGAAWTEERGSLRPSDEGRRCLRAPGGERVTRHERAASYGHGDRVRHRRARSAGRERDGNFLPGRQCLPGGQVRPGPAGPVGFRGGEPATRRPRVRPGPRRRGLGPAHRRGPGAGQRDPHQRRPAVRGSRPPGVLGARVHQPAGRRDLGQGGRAGDGGGGHPGRVHAHRVRDPAVQEQHRQQGRLVRLPRELPDEPGHPVRRHRAAPHPVLRVPPGGLRGRPGRPRRRRPGRGLPDQPARRLLRGRGRPGDHAEAPDHQHPRRAARRPGEVPPPARDHRRREHERDLQLPQARHDRAGAGDDRGPVPRLRPRDRGPGGRAAGHLPRPEPAGTWWRCATAGG